MSKMGNEKIKADLRPLLFHGVSDSSAFPEYCRLPCLVAPIHGLKYHHRESLILLIKNTLNNEDTVLNESLIFQESILGLPTQRGCDDMKGCFYFRQLEESDLEQCKQLHLEWFPLTYDEEFYSAIAQKKVFSLAAVYRPANQSQQDPMEYLVGIILASQRVGLHLKWIDLAHLISQPNLERLQHSHTLSNQTNDQCATSAQNAQQYQVDNNIPVVYILSLGVAQEFRGLSIATKLWNYTMRYFCFHIQSEEPIFYLHVVSYNKAAIKFYEKLGFRYILTYAVG